MIDDTVISFEEWKEDEFNANRDYGDYMHEVVLFDEVAFYDQWIAETEVEYLDAKHDGLPILAGTLRDLLPILREKRLSLVNQSNQQKRGEISSPFSTAS